MKPLKLYVLFLMSLLASVGCFAQKVCTSNPTTISTDINFGSIVWTPSGGATASECNDMADGLITFTGNVIVDLANNTTITITNDVNITGNFPISGGSGSKLSISGTNVDLHVTGDLGDAANNGVQYEVVSATSTIKVDGTLYGKNNNAFTGAGKISGGNLDVKNGSTCGTPCPVSGGFSTCDSGDSFCTTNNVLPITLLSFTARETGESVTLDWATIMEESFEKFVVERSSNGIQFNGIAEIPGAGKNIYDIKTEYNFNDSNPLAGFNYYRLKIVDIDQQFEYSPLRAVKIQSSKKFWVHPNPSSGSINFYTNFDATQADRIVLIDQMGKELIEVPADNSGSVEVSGDIRPGIYLLKYFTRGAQYSSRVILK
jgi:hypothetical protein